MRTKDIYNGKLNYNESWNGLFTGQISNKQKYDLAIIELVYNLEPFDYESTFNVESADFFIKKHRDYIDNNIVIEKHGDGESYICDAKQNFYGVIYEGSNDGIWNNTFYLKNEILDIKPNLAEYIHYSIDVSDIDEKLSLYNVLMEFAKDRIEINEEYHTYINKGIDKFKNKVSLSDYIKYINKGNYNGKPTYNPFS